MVFFTFKGLFFCMGKGGRKNHALAVFSKYYPNPPLIPGWQKYENPPYVSSTLSLTPYEAVYN